MDRSRGATHYLILWFRLFYGAHLLYSSVRFVLEPHPRAVNHPIGGPFVASLNATGIYPLVKYIELGTGLMIFFNLFVPLALVIEMPITVVIFILNTLVVASGWQLFSGPQEIFLNVLLMVFYGRYYLPLAKPIAPARPLWDAVAADLDLPPIR
jgi:riboflavin transporter